MHHDGVGLGEIEMLQAKAVELEILTRGEGRFVLPLEVSHVAIADDVTEDKMVRSLPAHVLAAAS